jgi:hypothetical protein
MIDTKPILQGRMGRFGNSLSLSQNAQVNEEQNRSCQQDPVYYGQISKHDG